MYKINAPIPATLPEEVQCDSILEEDAVSPFEVQYCCLVFARICPISSDALDQLHDPGFWTLLEEVSHIHEQIETFRAAILVKLEAPTSDRSSRVNLQRDVFNRRWARLSKHVVPASAASEVALLQDAVSRYSIATRVLDEEFAAAVSRNLDSLAIIYAQPDLSALARSEFPALLTRMRTATRAKSQRKVGMAMYRYLQRVSAKTSPRGRLGWVAQGRLSTAIALEQRIPSTPPQYRNRVNLGLIDGLLRQPGWGATIDVNRDVSTYQGSAVWLKTRWSRGGKGSLARESLVQASGLPNEVLAVQLPEGATRAQVEDILSRALKVADTTSVVGSFLASGLLCQYPALPMNCWTDLCRVADISSSQENGAALRQVATQVSSLDTLESDDRHAVVSSIRAGMSDLLGVELSEKLDVVREDAILVGDCVLSLGTDTRRMLSLLAAATVRAELRYAHLCTLGEQLRVERGHAAVPLMHAIQTWSQAPEWTESDPNPCTLSGVSEFLRARSAALQQIRASAAQTDGEISLDPAAVKGFVSEMAPYQVSPTFLSCFVQVCEQTGRLAVNGVFRGAGTLFGRFVEGTGIEAMREYVNGGVRRPLEVQGASMFNVNLHEDWIESRTDYPGHHTAIKNEGFVAFADLRLVVDAGGVPRILGPDGMPVDLLDLNVMAQHSLPEVRKFLSVFTCQLQPYSSWIVPRSRPAVIGRTTPRVRLGDCLLHRRRVALPINTLGSSTSSRLLSYHRAIRLLGDVDVAFGTLHGQSVTDNKPMWVDLRSPISISAFERFAKSQGAEAITFTEAVPDPRRSGAGRQRRHALEWTLDMVVRP